LGERDGRGKIDLERFWTKSREGAFRVMFYRRSKTGKVWHVGVSSDSVVMIDLDEKDWNTVRALVRLITSEVRACDAAVFETRRGFHVVFLCNMTREEWRRAYELAMNFPAVDKMHAELSLRYGSTVLRISEKDGDVPRLIAIYHHAEDRWEYVH